MISIYKKNYMKETKKQRQDYHQKCRLIVLKKYGDKCVYCGEDELAVLTIDHINNDGSKDKYRNQSRKFYYELRNMPIRDDLQILCHNCQWRKIAYGNDFSKWNDCKKSTTIDVKPIRNYNKKSVYSS